MWGATKPDQGSSWSSSQNLPPPDTRTIKSFLNGNDPLEVFSLLKIPSYKLQPSILPILSSSKEVLAMSDSTNLAKDLLGKFDIENVFSQEPSFPGKWQSHSHQTTKVRSIFHFILFYFIYNTYLHIYLYKTVIIYNSDNLFTRFVKNINCNPIRYSFNLLFVLFLISRLEVYK